MDGRPIPTTKTRIVKRKGRQHSLQVQSYHHEPFISCLAGLYSCRWKRYQRNRVKPGHCCCSVREGIFFTVLVITFSFWFIFTYLWGQIRNDYPSFDRYSFDNIGFWFHWSTFLLVLCVIFIVYLSFLMVIAVCLLSCTQELYLHWIHKMGTLFILGLCILAFIIITFLWTNQWATLSLSFQVTAPFFHLGGILIMIFLAWPVAKHFFHMENKVSQAFILCPYLCVLLFLLFIPLGMYSPCVREEGTLGPKPLLIGHRGAPMVAPENTEMSFRKSIEHGAAGLETDVTISFDGVPFLMHDRTLKRTTNVDTVFPERPDIDASMSPWSQLKILNAGEWFFEKRPFISMPMLSEEDEQLARKQQIYKFSDFLKLADQENKYVIFDLYRPPKFHPYRDKWISRTLDVILNESKIRTNLVLWLTAENRSYVHSVAPGFKQVSSIPVSVEELQKRNIVKLNLDYRMMGRVNIRKYAEANITTNFWVVNEPWLFSLAWCYGAHSVTTNAVHSLKAMTEPDFLMEDFAVE
ncbi:glycerophosphodiester phosphodiesterase domain-containing protein 5-like isoform X2 [Sceloporus undulatus]|uniref:glycerophosphodiester phosphodiesterase domain-containing protein 5-like isoform X2 n=1 Tax=Sceloporus undulatus TaxID=8520 RepID=UPI001C4C8B3F|nr:glycerophosphodiester phosphodiesterase domain-containing protein 5-like isoform X2 [Sceloporus undulatus]